MYAVTLFRGNSHGFLVADFHAYNRKFQPWQDFVLAQDKAQGIAVIRSVKDAAVVKQTLKCDGDGVTFLRFVHLAILSKYSFDNLTPNDCQDHCQKICGWVIIS